MSESKRTTQIQFRLSISLDHALQKEAERRGLSLNETAKKNGYSRTDRYRCIDFQRGYAPSAFRDGKFHAYLLICISHNVAKSDTDRRTGN